VVFAGNRRTGKVDFEAIEMLVRDSMHRAGAMTLERLLAMPEPTFSKTSCGCGHTAQYQEKRAKHRVLSVRLRKESPGYFSGK